VRRVYVPFNQNLSRLHPVFHRLVPQMSTAASLTTFAGMFRDRMPPVLAAASALVVFGRFHVPAQVVQQPAHLGTMLSQRWRAHASLQDKVHRANERLQLLCCGCPLSILLLRLATVVEHSGRTSIQHMHVVCIMKRCFSGVARRLWSKCNLDPLALDCFG
jgi:hypothetical protein